MKSSTIEIFYYILLGVMCFTPYSRSKGFSEKAKDIYVGFVRAVMIFTIILVWCALTGCITNDISSMDFTNAYIISYIPVCTLLLRRELLMREDFYTLQREGLFFDMVFIASMFLVIVEIARSFGIIKIGG